MGLPPEDFGCFLTFAIHTTAGCPRFYLFFTIERGSILNKCLKSDCCSEKPQLDGKTASGGTPGVSMPAFLKTWDSRRESREAGKSMLHQAGKFLDYSEL